MATPALNPVVPQAAPEPTSVFLRACRGLPTERTPIWLMRQAGRYMPEYRALRQSHGMLDLIRTPELAAEVTLQPIEAFGFDAAIIFSDILPPLVGMGFELDFVRGVGPQIANRIERPYDVDVLGTPPAEETMAGTLEAIRIVARELGSERRPRDRLLRARPSPSPATPSRAARRRTSRAPRRSCSPSRRHGSG